MFKKIFKAATVFTLLVGCYLGYVQVFALVVREMTTVRRGRAEGPFLPLKDFELPARVDETRQRCDATRPLGHKTRPELPLL